MKKSKEEKIKGYDLLLQNYIDNKEYVKIYRTVNETEDNISGYILKMTDKLLLILNAGDFIVDGYSVIRKDGFDRIRCGKYEKTQRKIFKQEKLVDLNWEFTQPILLSDWTETLRALKKMDYHIIVEQIVENGVDFFIGEIVRVTNENLYIRNYDPTGLFDKKATKMELEKIWTVQFGDRYSTVFRKYLKSPK